MFNGGLTCIVQEHMAIKSHDYLWCHNTLFFRKSVANTVKQNFKLQAKKPKGTFQNKSSLFSNSPSHLLKLGILVVGNTLLKSIDWVV